MVGQELYQKITLLHVYCFIQLLELKKVHIGSFICLCVEYLSTIKKNIVSWLDAVTFSSLQNFYFFFIVSYLWTKLFVYQGHVIRK